MLRQHCSACRQGAEEFRDAKRARDGVGEKLQPLPAAKRQRGVAFGSGVADEDDVYGMVSAQKPQIARRRSGLISSV